MLNATHTSPATQDKRFSVILTKSRSDIERCQRLRYQIFADEMGAQLHTDKPGYDIDMFDEHCEHLMVIEETTGELAATTRIMTNSSAAGAGQFYSQTEFDIDNILAMNKNFMEIGRTCVSEKYRTSPAINFLWQGVARTMMSRSIDYLFGCVSIPIINDDQYIHALMKYLKQKHLAPLEQRVMPITPLSKIIVQDDVQVVLPSLLKRYLNIGAVICGEPSWDADFNVADIFILVDTTKISPRYEKRFLYGA